MSFNHIYRHHQRGYCHKPPDYRTIPMALCVESRRALPKTTWIRDDRHPLYAIRDCARAGFTNAPYCQDRLTLSISLFKQEMSCCTNWAIPRPAKSWRFLAVIPLLVAVAAQYIGNKVASRKVKETLTHMKIIRTLAGVYAALFLFVVALGYIPGLTNADGQLLGLFKIDPIDDIVHLVSGIWAAIAAMRSTRASILYFRIFGSIYSLDAVFGLLFGEGILDAGIIRHGVTQLDLGTRIASNMPHIVIGGLALLIGFGLGRRITQKQYA